MNLECDAYKRTEMIVSESLLSQEYKMKYVTKCKLMLHNDKPIMFP